ncbi:hypothetical protein Tco_1369481 [Tanacetum coccineum]
MKNPVFSLVLLKGVSNVVRLLRRSKERWCLVDSNSRVGDSRSGLGQDSFRHCSNLSLRRAESPDEVLLEITPAFCTFNKGSFEPSLSDAFQFGPLEKEILRNSLRSCPLTSNVELSGKVNLPLVLFRSRAKYCSIVRVLIFTFSVSDSDDSDS